MKKAGYLILFLILVMTGCGKKQEEVIEEQVKYVITEPATMRKMNQVFKSDAVLEPKNKVNHQTEKGGTIEKILKRNGDTVKKGELVMDFQMLLQNQVISQQKLIIHQHCLHLILQRTTIKNLRIFMKKSWYLTLNM